MMGSEQNRGVPNRDGWDELLDGLCEDRLSDSEWQRLVELLGQSEAFRRRYLEYVELHATLWSGGAFRQPECLSLALAEAADHEYTVPDTAAFVRSRSSRFTHIACLASALAAMLLLAVGIVRLSYQGMGSVDGGGDGRAAVAFAGPQVPTATNALAPASSIAVARLVRTYDCAWSDAATHPSEGDALMGGKPLVLRSGLAEIEFSSGVRLILQGPARFQPESPRSALLLEGKITATVEDAAAKGFTINTPGMKAVDLGTEFGLEVSTSGIEQVHVFRGEVVVAPTSENGRSVAPQHLLQSQGIEINTNTQGVKLMANNGEHFARSLDDAEKNRHVVAHWRFEDHAVGVLVPDSNLGKNPVRGSLDSSINSNDLYAWNEQTQPRFSGDVPAATIPQTGETNAASLDNTVPPGGLASRDLFTMSYWSHPSFTDLQTITPAQWTIEASIKPAELPGRYQTFLVRDGVNACSANPKVPPLAFQVTPDRHIKVLFCDVEQRLYDAIALAVTVQENHWYHVAASSDGKVLRLYVDSLDGKGYCLWAQTGLAREGSTALGRGSYDSSDPLAAASGGGYPYIWSVGRGYYGGQVTDWFRGWIDEVRICDAALEPTEFLFSPPASTDLRQDQAHKQTEAARK